LYSSTFSNLGIFRLPEPLAGHVLDFHAMLGESPVNHIKILSYCYNGLVSLTFSSRLLSDELENTMCKSLRAKVCSTTLYAGRKLNFTALKVNIQTASEALQTAAQRRCFFNAAVFFDCGTC
ncbi:MAG: hypothetical protein IJU45_03320, partial [Clostridia bacterium]|nr:hypothetical protein [Clostridia bacterium]